MYRKMLPITTPVFSDDKKHCLNRPIYCKPSCGYTLRPYGGYVLMLPNTDTIGTMYIQNSFGCEIISIDRFVHTVLWLFDTIKAASICWKTQGNLTHGCNGVTGSNEVTSFVDTPETLSNRTYLIGSRNCYKTKTSVMVLENSDSVVNYGNFIYDRISEPDIISDPWWPDVPSTITDECQCEICGCNRAELSIVDVIKFPPCDDNERAFIANTLVKRDTKPYFVIALEFCVTNNYITLDEKNFLIELFYPTFNPSHYEKNIYTFSLPKMDIITNHNYSQNDYNVYADYNCSSISYTKMMSNILIKTLRGICKFNQYLINLPGLSPSKTRAGGYLNLNKQFAPDEWTDNEIIVPEFDDEQKLINPPTFDENGKQNGGATLIKDKHFSEILYYGCSLPILFISKDSIEMFDIYSVTTGDSTLWEDISIINNIDNDWSISSLPVVVHSLIQNDHFENGIQETGGIWWLTTNGKLVKCNFFGYIENVYTEEDFPNIGLGDGILYPPVTPFWGKQMSCILYNKDGGYIFNAGKIDTARELNKIYLNMPVGKKFTPKFVVSTDMMHYCGSYLPYLTSPAGYQIGYKYIFTVPMNIVTIEEREGGRFGDNYGFFMTMGNPRFATTDTAIYNNGTVSTFPNNNTILVPNIGGIISCDPDINIISIMPNHNNIYSTVNSQGPTNTNWATFCSLYAFCSDNKLYEVDIDVLRCYYLKSYVINTEQKSCKEVNIIQSPSELSFKIQKNSTGKLIFLFKFNDIYKDFDVCSLNLRSFVKSISINYDITATVYKLDEIVDFDNFVDSDTLQDLYSGNNDIFNTMTYDNIVFHKGIIGSVVSPLVNSVENNRVSENGYAIVFDFSYMASLIVDENEFLDIQIMIEEILYNFSSPLFEEFIPIVATLQNGQLINTSKITPCLSITPIIKTGFSQSVYSSPNFLAHTDWSFGDWNHPVTDFDYLKIVSEFSFNTQDCHGNNRQFVSKHQGLIKPDVYPQNMAGSGIEHETIYNGPTGEFVSESTTTFVPSHNILKAYGLVSSTSNIDGALQRKYRKGQALIPGGLVETNCIEFVTKDQFYEDGVYQSCLITHEEDILNAVVAAGYIDWCITYTDRYSYYNVSDFIISLQKPEIVSLIK